MIKDTELKIATIFANATNEAQIEFNYELKIQLFAIKTKMKYDKINLISGMGTTTIDISHKCQEYSETENDFPHDAFKEINEFIQFMAGQYNLYPKSILV